MLSENRIIFAKNILKQRKKKGLMQTDLIKKTGLTQPFISTIENGIANISLDNMSKIAMALETPLWKLLKEPE